MEKKLDVAGGREALQRSFAATLCTHPTAAFKLSDRTVSGCDAGDRRAVLSGVLLAAPKILRGLKRRFGFGSVTATPVSTAGG
jgi:hypothetical protein